MCNRVIRWCHRYRLVTIDPAGTNSSHHGAWNSLNGSSSKRQTWKIFQWYTTSFRLSSQRNIFSHTTIVFLHQDKRHNWRVIVSHSSLVLYRHICGFEL